MWSGGLELLFSSVKIHEVDVPPLEGQTKVNFRSDRKTFDSLNTPNGEVVLFLHNNFSTYESLWLVMEFEFELSIEILPPECLQLTVKYLLFWIQDNLLKERPEMFLKEKSV
ncbi:hypothetical protein R1flu_008946 [Riccia fluitans]|uniref:Uncharacterized protein n=1 Tax=Riccia fluitans TaxID=41844 RepID=A0ABD1Z388_9MARC